jgi:Arc/MetJ-type ribon-helix-helix transcriptional regulator
MGKQETFQVTVDEDRVNALRRRVSDGEFPSIEAAIAAALDAFDDILPPIGDVDLDAMAEEGAKSGEPIPWDPEAVLVELKARPLRTR